MRGRERLSIGRSLCRVCEAVRAEAAPCDRQGTATAPWLTLDVLGSSGFGWRLTTERARERLSIRRSLCGAQALRSRHHEL